MFITIVSLLCVVWTVFKRVSECYVLLGRGALVSIIRLSYYSGVLSDKYGTHGAGQ